MALLYECRELCTYIVLDIADIVRDGDFAAIYSSDSCHGDWGRMRCNISAVHGGAR